MLTLVQSCNSVSYEFIWWAPPLTSSYVRIRRYLDGVFIHQSTSRWSWPRRELFRHFLRRLTPQVDVIGIIYTISSLIYIIITPFCITQDASSTRYHECPEVDSAHVDGSGIDHTRHSMDSGESSVDDVGRDGVTARRQVFRVFCVAVGIWSPCLVHN